MEQVQHRESRFFSFMTYWKEVLAVLIILLAIYFFRNQVGEIKSIIPNVLNANFAWTLPALMITLLFVFLQALMYVASFRSVGIRINVPDATELYLKRNVLSVFLPAGAIASLAYTPHRLKKKQVNSPQGVKASLLFGYIAIFTVFLVGVPVVAYTLVGQPRISHSWMWLLLLGGLLLAMVLVLWSFVRKGFVYRLFVRINPLYAEKLEGLLTERLDKKALFLAVFYSCLIEFVCMALVYCSVRAMGFTIGIEVAAVGYIVSVIPMMISPFLRGLGAVELTLAFILTAYGFDTASAMGTTLLYRIFQFWLPMLLGLFAFLWKGKELIGRTLPAAGLLLLGMANILSVLNIPLAEHLQWGLFILPVEHLPISQTMILFVSIVMLLVAANLMRGHKNAYVLALFLTLFSVVWHLSRSLNPVQAIVEFVLLVLLVVYRKEYRVKSDLRWLSLGFRAFYLIFAAVLLFDVLGFYWLDKRHFGMEFTLLQSVEYTLRSLFLLDNDLVPTSGFAKEFLSWVHVLAFCVWLMLVFTLFKTRRSSIVNTHKNKPEAERIVGQWGRSPMDVLKIGNDKDCFIDKELHAVIAYKVEKGIAVVLEGPVCDTVNRQEALLRFELFCRGNGWKPCYFMVDEQGLSDYAGFSKKKILFGQEAILDVERYVRQKSASRAGFRTGVNGLKVEYLDSPYSDSLLEELQAVSDQWLVKTRRKEVGFFTWSFDADALKSQAVVLAREGVSGKPVAFISVVTSPDAGECAISLFRTGLSAPLGCEKALVDCLVQEMAHRGYTCISLGLASTIGVVEPEIMPERIQHYVTKRFRFLRYFYYRRAFLEPFATEWKNRYLLYDSDFDLFLIPIALRRVSRPSLNEAGIF